MCGIIGCVAEEPVAGILLEGLRRVEYRGYDSAGMATISGGRLGVKKGAGRVSEIEGRYRMSSMLGSTGMAHTRWATHGGVDRRERASACIVQGHGGRRPQRDNRELHPLKKALQAKGHRFKSETDTEVISHIVEDEYKRLRDPLKATLAAVKKLKGQYAIVVMFQDTPDVMTGARKDAPLIVGVGKGMTFLASDVLAFIGHTDRTIFLDNYEAVEITEGSVRIVGPDGKRVKREPNQVAWELSDVSKSDYAHYTLKEINEQPRTVVSAAAQDPEKVEEFAQAIRKAKSLYIRRLGPRTMRDS